MTSDERAERLLAQLHQWAMEAMELPRADRDTFFEEVAERYYRDALTKGLTEAQASDWRRSVNDWVRELVDVIETSGGAQGGHA